MSDDDSCEVEAPALRGPKPVHYMVICISIYKPALEDLDAKVAELKRRGCTKVSRSQLIRLAMRMLDVDAAERTMRGVL